MFLNFFSGEIAKIYKKNSKAHLSTFDSKHLPLLYCTATKLNKKCEACYINNKINTTKITKMVGPTEFTQN